MSSVRPSETLVNCDHIGWNSSNIISPSVSFGGSLFATPTWRVCFKGNTLNLGQKSPTPCWFERRRHPIAIAAEWSQIAQRSQWRAYRKPPSLFLMVPSLTPYDLSFPLKMGVTYAPNIYANGHSLQRVIRSTSCLVLWWGFRGGRIERRYLRLEQIQDGGRRHVGKISNGHISATGRPIHFMFCSRAVSYTHLTLPTNREV